MRTEYKKNINGTCLVLEEAVVYDEDYQVQMIAVNEITGLLPLKAQGINERSRYYYVVNGKISLKAMYEKAKIGKRDLELFLDQFLQTVRAVYDHMLNINRIILEPEFIFYEEEQFYFCYYPLGNEELNIRFHRLTEYIVQQIDYEDQEVICMAYELHKKTMTENYSVEHVIGQISQERKEEAEDPEETAEAEKPFELQLVTKSSLVKTQKMAKKNPLTKILQRRKSKWGHWGDLP